MYGLLIDGVEVAPPKPINSSEEMKIWEKIVRDAAAIAAPGSLVDACLLPIEDWLTENLPETNPPMSTRPGAEYGAE
jgi:hypothetical protein